MSGVILKPTNPIIGAPGILEFPYTPQIDYSNDVKYDSFSLTHTNYQPYAYARTENPQINIQAKFSSHTVEHFKISERAIRFLRTYTKMNYGREDKQRGQTPRILRFSALGYPMFNKVPVVINKFNITFPDDVDYIQGAFTTSDETKDVQNVQNVGNRPPTTEAGQLPGVTITGRIFYLPAVFQISIGLLVQQNIAKTVKEFTLEKFGSGKMNEFGYI